MEWAGVCCLCKQSLSLPSELTHVLISSKQVLGNRRVAESSVGALQSPISWPIRTQKCNKPMVSFRRCWIIPGRIGRSSSAHRYCIRCLYDLTCSTDRCEPLAYGSMTRRRRSWFGVARAPRKTPMCITAKNTAVARTVLFLQGVVVSCRSFPEYSEKMWARRSNIGHGSCYVHPAHRRSFSHLSVFVCMHSYKGEGEVDAPPGQVLHYVTPGNDLPRKQWDSTTKVNVCSMQSWCTFITRCYWSRNGRR